MSKLCLQQRKKFIPVFFVDRIAETLLFQDIIFKPVVTLEILEKFT